MKKTIKYILLISWVTWAIWGILKNYHHYSFVDWMVALIFLLIPSFVLFRLAKKDCSSNTKDIESVTLSIYKEDGVEKYQILATLDNRTCDICGELDGQVYWVKKAKIGVNYPPFHQNCRCTTIPYYDDIDLTDQTRVARDPATGTTYEVPAEMTYKEWKKQFWTSHLN